MSDQDRGHQSEPNGFWCLGDASDQCPSKETCGKANWDQSEPIPEPWQPVHPTVTMCQLRDGPGNQSMRKRNHNQANE